MSDIVLRNVSPPKDDDILSVDIYSDGKARCYSWSDKWIDAEVIDSKPVTNADRIRAMTDEELAEMFDEYSKRNDVCPKFGAYSCHGENCFACWLDWLKSPVEEVSNG